MAADAKVPAKRADAARNRDKILAAAREAFADPEADVSMAGVGMATLYRNFPGRRELLEALYSEVIDGILAAAEEGSGGSAGERFTAWLRAFLDFSTSKRQLVAELLVEDDDRSVFNENRARVMAAGEPLLVAARESGEIRTELSLAQTLELVIVVGKIRGGADFVEPILGATLEGLRPPS